jgi:Domain of unknown function (DUF4268)
MTEIGDLKRWPARDLWPGEATHFNPWLASNLGVLDAALSSDWTLAEGEVQQSAGSLWVDIVARTSSGHTACIESQFGTSNHDHLGKLLTYIAAYDARVAVWIAEDVRPEHVQAVISLNSKFQDVDFYLLQLEVVSIDEAPRKAPLISRVVGPSPLIRQGGSDQEQQSEARQRMHEFWLGVAPVVSDLVPRFKGRPAPHARWFGVSAGRRGMRFRMGVRQHDAECALTIFGGSRNGESEPVLGEVQTRREEIESAFGGTIDWVSAPRSHIRVGVAEGGYLDRDEWPTLQTAVAETMARFVSALEPAVAELKSRPIVGALEEEDEEETED